MDTPAAAVDYGCKVSTKHGAIHWALRIVAKRKNGREAVVAYYGHHPEGRSIAWHSRASREWDAAAVEPKVEQHRKGQVWTLELSAQLDIDVYQSAWAEVVAYNGMDFSAAPLVDQRLSEN